MDTQTLVAPLLIWLAQGALTALALLGYEWFIEHRSSDIGRTIEIEKFNFYNSLARFNLDGTSLDHKS